MRKEFTKTVKYVCVECQAEVKALGKNTRQDLKLCGYCGKTKKIVKKWSKQTTEVIQDAPVKPPSKPVETLTVNDVFKPINQELNLEQVKSNPAFNEEITGKIKAYQLILSRVIDLLLELKEGHNETFLTLWLKAKGELNHD